MYRSCSCGFCFHYYVTQVPVTVCLFMFKGCVPQTLDRNNSKSTKKKVSQNMSA